MADAVDAQIVEQGNKVRDLKAKKADKAAIKAEVDVLLSLKAKYKELAGKDWKPGSAAPAPAKAAPAKAASPGADLDAKITEQGNKVRDMKAKKADKAEVKAAVDVLLSLKAEYKAATGSDWKPGSAAPAPAPAPTPAATAPASYGGGGFSDAEKAKLKSASESELDAQIQGVGDHIRKLKADKADKAVVQNEVATLLFLKTVYKEKAGGDWVPPEKRGKAEKKKEQPQQPKLAEG